MATAGPPFDVIVAGAGATGLMVADLLVAKGLRCAVLEAGPLDLTLPDSAEALHRRSARYDPPATGAHRYLTSGLETRWQRVRAAGGRTLLWGGWCARFSPQAFEDSRIRGAPWPLGRAELEPWYEQVERRLGVRRQAVPRVLRAAAAELGLPIDPKRMARHGARPAVTTDLRRTLPMIQPGATVVDVLVDSSRTARGVRYLDRAGRPVDVEGRAVVLCLSAIETVRLLLASSARPHLEVGDQVGRAMTDHLVLSWLTLVPGPAPGPAGAAVIPRFVNTSPDDARDYIGGFCLELLGPLPAAQLGADRLALLELDGETATHYHAYVIHALGDAGPHPDRFVDLHLQDRDTLGRPLAVLHTAWSAQDALMARDMEEAALALCDVLAPGGGRVIPLTVALQCGGPVHETGGCAMGDSASPADAFGGVRGVSRLFVADTSAMPSAGDAHPTLTAMAVAWRTADHLAKILCADQGQG